LKRSKVIERILVALVEQADRAVIEDRQAGIGERPGMDDPGHVSSAPLVVAQAHGTVDAARFGGRATRRRSVRWTLDSSAMALIQFRRHFRKGGYDGIDGHRQESPTRAAELHR
jgi:hypothetical protein